jgi:hypothetical protein
MNLLFIITLVVVTGLVWGGFIFFLSRAIKHEKKKKKNVKSST